MIYFIVTKRKWPTVIRRVFGMRRTETGRTFVDRLEEGAALAKAIEEERRAWRDTDEVEVKYR
jgi:hypothetical protein